MYLKSCCALLLLALVACQAAPSTSKNIEKKSISEKTSKIEKEDIKLEDFGSDKDRAKKSTTFCVEVHDGIKHHVPCGEQQQQQSMVLVQPELPKQTLLQPPTYHFPTHLVPETKFVPTALPQPIQVIQQPQPLQQIAQPVAQPIAQPAPPSVIYVQPPQPQSLPAPVQAPAQAPIVNILTPPAAPCNVMPAPTVVHEEQKHESVKVEQHTAPPKQEPQKLRPIAVQQAVEVFPAESPVRQEMIVLRPRPLQVYPEKLAVQVTELEQQPQPLAEAQCICTQKGRPNPAWARTHHKVHEHHVVLQPAANVLPASPLVVQPPCPYHLSSQPNMFGNYPRATYGDTIIAVHQEPRPYYANAYPNVRPVTFSEYPTYPVKNYGSRPYAPSVTVNAFNDQTGTFRQAESTPQKLVENNKSEKRHPDTTTMINVPEASVYSGTSKREADLMQLEKHQQANIVQDQAVESNKSATELKFGEQQITK